mmetsp:Transcript_7906/g.26258  ORF Transcript_7906/g.26258 Transcript_7906/m.26258 type:complete len:429 (-) Transcript_7906:156-1442(-)
MGTHASLHPRTTTSGGSAFSDTAFTPRVSSSTYNNKPAASFSASADDAREGGQVRAFAKLGLQRMTRRSAGGADEGNLAPRSRGGVAHDARQVCALGDGARARAGEEEASAPDELERELVQGSVLAERAVEVLHARAQLRRVEDHDVEALCAARVQSRPHILLNVALLESATIRNPVKLSVDARELERRRGAVDARARNRPAESSVDAKPARVAAQVEHPNLSPASGGRLHHRPNPRTVLTLVRVEPRFLPTHERRPIPHAALHNLLLLVSVSSRFVSVFCSRVAHLEPLELEELVRRAPEDTLHLRRRRHNRPLHLLPPLENVRRRRHNHRRLAKDIHRQPAHAVAFRVYEPVRVGGGGGEPERATQCRRLLHAGSERGVHVEEEIRTCRHVRCRLKHANAVHGRVIMDAPAQETPLVVLHNHGFAR